MLSQGAHMEGPRRRWSCSRPCARLRHRGMTLVEILIVLALVGLMMGALIAGSGQTSSARLRQSTALISGAVRVAYARASAVSKPVRLVFDFQEKTLSLEESSGVMLRTADKSAAGGADPATDAEREAIAEGERITKGPTAPRATFKPSTEAGFSKEPKKLPPNIEFRSIQTDHDDEPRTEGRAYLYFWPGGQTERATVQVHIAGDADEDVMSLEVSPLTGKVVVKPGVVAFERTDGKEINERAAPGGF